MRSLALIVVALSGCSGVGEQIPGDGRLVIVSYDDAFESNFFADGRTEASAVREGIHFWNALGANLRLPEEVAPGDVADSIYMIKRDTFSWPGLHGPWGMTMAGLGYSTIYPSDMRNDHGLDFANMRSNVAHEVGHAIGLNHVTDVSVMSPDHNYVGPTPTVAGRQEYARHYVVRD